MGASFKRIEHGGTCFEALFTQRWYLSYYQRPYTRGTDFIDAVILERTINAFDEQYSEAHSVETRANYDYGMMGDIIITTVETEVNGDKVTKNYIVDGQQRMRSFQLMLIVINNLYPKLELGGYIRTNKNAVSGKVPIIDDPVTNATVISLSQGIVPTYKGVNSSIKNLIANYKHLYKMFVEMAWSEEKMEAFVGWVLYNVQLGYKKCAPEDAPRVFVQSNTDNQNLEQHEIFKSVLIRDFEQDEEKAKAFDTMWNNGWDGINDKYRISSAKYDEIFAAFMRGLFGTETGTTATKNFDTIAKKGGVWFNKNKTALGLNDSEKTFDFAMKVIAQVFKTLDWALSAMREYSKETEFVFFADQLGVNYLLPLMTSVTAAGDTEAVAKHKMNVLAFAATKLTLEYSLRNKSREDGKVRPLTVDLMNSTRNKSPKDMVSSLKEIVTKFTNIMEEEGHQPNLSPNRHELTEGTARFVVQLATHFWEEVDKGYVDVNFVWLGKKLSAPTLEHTIASKFSFYLESCIFTDEADHQKKRETLAIIGILPQSVNSQLGDAPLPEKFNAYMAKGGAWLSLMAPQSYNNGVVISTNIRRFVKANTQFVLAPIAGELITLEDISLRNTLLIETLKFIFSDVAFDKLVKKTSEKSGTEKAEDSAEVTELMESIDTLTAVLSEALVTETVELPTTETVA